MINLRGVKVLLVDDSLDEALPVIKAFAKKGIPVAYFDGNIEDLPASGEKLYGVRLAILDMDLIGGGDRDENKISTLISRLQAILSADNGPYTMVAWTKHSELVGLLIEKLFGLFQVEGDEDKVPLPIVVICLEKKDYRDDNLFNIEKLSSVLEEELKRSKPLHIMQGWEESCLRAASGVTNTLSELISPSKGNFEVWQQTWNNSYMKLLLLLAEEEVGKDNLTSDTFPNALLSALNPLHMDFLETNEFAILQIQDEDLRNRPNGGNNSALIAGKINAKLHLAFEKVAQFCPGNIYKLAEFPHLFTLAPNDLFKDCVQKDHIENATLFNRVTAILLEVSPLCDYAQNKIKLARFLAGFIVPADEKNKFKLTKDNGGFLLAFGPLWINDADCFLILNSQYSISLNYLQAKQTLRAFARLRHQGLTQVQFWMAQQLSRQGIVMLK